MDGRAGVPPTENNGSVARDVADRLPASARPVEPTRSIPLTIREVVRRGRAERDEVDRLRGEVEQLRLRAESAEQQLQAAPNQAAPIGAAPTAHDGGVAADGNGRASRQRKRASSDSTSRWATAAVLPRSPDA